MGKLRRTGLWVACPPAGAVASIRAGTQKRHEETVEAIREIRSLPEPSRPEAVTEIASLLDQAGIKGRDRLRLTAAAMKHVHEGESVEDALAAVLPQ